MTQGHIKISRAILDWRWSDNPVMMYVWIRLLLMANWRDKEWHDRVIKRGSFVTTLSSLSGQMNLSVQQVRTCLDRLKANKEIDTVSTNAYTLITICKYEDYQGCATNEQQTNNTPDNNPITTTKEYKNKEKKEDNNKLLSKKESPDYESIMLLWNSFAQKPIPKINSLTPARKEKVRLRVKEMGGMDGAKATLEECFKKISESNFCNGKVGKWVATFDWFFANEKNWLKVLEGNYDNRGAIFDEQEEGRREYPDGKYWKKDFTDKELMKEFEFNIDMMRWVRQGRPIRRINGQWRKDD